MNTTKSISILRFCLLGLLVMAVAWVFELFAPHSTVRAGLFLGTPAEFSPTEVAPASASTDARAVKVFPDAIDVRIPLGTTHTVTLTIQNVATTTLRPTFFEAWAIPAPGTANVAQTVQEAKIKLPDQAEAVDAQIMTDLAAAPDGLTTFFVLLHEQPDLSAAYRIADWGERGWFVYRTLTEHANRTQREIRALLDARGTSYEPLWIVNGLIVRGNRDDLRALAAREEVALLRADRVMSLHDEQAGMGQATTVSGCEPDERGICWNILQVGADRVWSDFGVSGQGITVGSMDSGVNYTHHALYQQYRGYQDRDQYQHEYNWYDAVHGTPTPVDLEDHGSHTMGTIVGRGDGTPEHPAIGVAPGARWISARICETTTCRESDILAAAQWMLAPTDALGKHPRPDLRPHVVNNSWSTGEGGAKNFVDFVTAWRAAGIFPVFAAGNSSSHETCGSIASPGDYDTVVAVGATEKNGLIAPYSRFGPSERGTIKPDLVAPGSSIVSALTGTNDSYGVMNGTSMATPHVAGAVALIWSANPSLIGNYEATYSILTTSATPRTGDERFSLPNCNTNQSPNNIYGHGFLNTYRAVALAKVDVPWLELSHAPELSLKPEQSVQITVVLNARRLPTPGDYRARILIGTGDLSQTPYPVAVTMRVTNPTYSAVVKGNVFDARTALPASRAVIQVVGGATLQPDTNGFYRVTIPLPDQDVHRQTLVFGQPGYVSRTTTISVSDGIDYLLDVHLEPDRPIIVVGEATTAARDITLDYGQRVQFTIPMSNAGTQPLTYHISVPFAPFSVWRSDEHPGINRQWILPPEPAQSITLTDDGFSDFIPLGFSFPFADTHYTAVRVGSNGLLVFGDPKETGGFVPWDSGTSEATPIPETESVAIMPLRTDLNPEEGGSVRYANTAEGFLVTYENVPLFGKPDRAFTFQVLLSRDGSITFSYKKLSAVPKFITVGVQVSAAAHQIVGEGDTVPITDNLVLMLRPQPNSQQWIVPLATEGHIEPGGHVLVPGELHWAYPFLVQPYVGSVAIRSNDGDRPKVLVPIRIHTKPFSHTITVSPSEQRQPITEQFTIPEGYRVRWHIPVNTFSTTTTLTYTQAKTPQPDTWPKGMIPTVQVFSLSASPLQSQSLSRDEALGWNKAITLTLGYDPSGLNEKEQRSMQLWRWSGEQWEPIATLSNYRHDVKNHEVSIAIRSRDLGDLALFFHRVRYPLYLPIVTVASR